MINWTKIRSEIRQIFVLSFWAILFVNLTLFLCFLRHFSSNIKSEFDIFLQGCWFYKRKKTLLFFWALKFNKFIILCLWIIFSPHYSILIKSFWNEKKQLLHSIICPSIPLSLINKSYLLIVIDIATFLIHC